MDFMFVCFFFLINCWSSAVASVVLPQFVQSPLSFLWKITSREWWDRYSNIAPKRAGEFGLF